MLLQASCAFADMANTTADLTLNGAETVVSFLSSHIAGLREEAAATNLAPLPNGDPFKCVSKTTLYRAVVQDSLQHSELRVCLSNMGC